MMKTKNEVAMNLADIALYYSYGEKYRSFLEGTQCNRFYIGSYFCGKYCMKSMWILGDSLHGLFLEHGWKLSLVVPIPMEYERNILKSGVKRFLEAFRDTVDEVIVNDYGMLDFINTLKSELKLDIRIVAGRLFSRNYRDARYEDYSESEVCLYFPELLRGKVQAAEADIVSERMDFSEFPEDVDLHIHYPLTYLTYGQNCEFASTQQNDAFKFRPGLPCGTQCMAGFMKTASKDGTDFWHVGKAVFMKNPKVLSYSKNPERFIYWPLEEFMMDR